MINATSSGINGEIPAIPASLVHSHIYAYDMFYQKGKTPFLTWCEQQGAKHVADGLGMLVGQAAHAVLLWHGVLPAVEPVIEKLKQESKKNGTVGCVVLDRKGNLTAGTSTGGMFKKKWGRIGDSPVIGAGTYADNNSCAVSCTGHGEYFIRHAVAFNVCARYKYLQEPVEKAAGYIINTELNTNEGNGGLIAVDKQGNIAMPFNSTGMFRGYLYKQKGSDRIEKKVGIGDKLVSFEGK